jgi:hypothetical protein
MRKPAHTLAPFLLIAAASLAQSKNIHEQVDPYNGHKTLLLEVSTRTCPGDPPLRDHDPTVHILFSTTQNPDGTTAYFLTPELDHGSTLNVRANGTLDALIDNTVATFHTPAGSTIRTSYDAGLSYLHETIPT